MPTTTLYGSAVPDIVDVGPDDPVTLHSVITPQKDCALTHIRFYKHANNTGTHVGGVWELGNPTPIATLTFTDETEDGWQEQALDTPVQLTAGQTYTIGVLMPNGHWSAWTSLMLWDVAFNEATPITFGLRFKVSQPAVVKGAAFAKLTAGDGWGDMTLTAKLWTNDGTQLASGQLVNPPAWDGSLDQSWAEIEFDTPVEIEADTLYVVSVHTPEGAYHAAGGAMDADKVRDIITLLGNSTEMPNCVFAYTSNLDEFPEDHFNASYYGLDVLLDDYLFAPAFHASRISAFGYAATINAPTDYASSRQYAVDGIFSFDEDEPVELAVDEASHALTSDSITLIPHHVLEIDSARHGHTVDALELTQAYVLGVNDAQHAHSVDAITLRLPSTRTPGPDELVLVPPEDRLTLVAPEERLTIVH